MEISGACFCGELAYEADIEEDAIAICHCRDCQIFSGSAFRTSGIVAPDRFRVTKGIPKHFDKVADSGAVRRMLFCGECGTHICSVPTQQEGAFISIRVATSHDFDKLKPAAEVFCRSRVAWQAGLDGAVEFDKMFERDG